jgi:hypothetical protein
MSMSVSHIIMALVTPRGVNFRKETTLASEFPYMPSAKNLSAILDKIRGAGTPPKFTHEFLKSTLGFASSGDRGVIQVLKALGFLGSDSTPTTRYNQFRAETGKSRALADGLQEGWSELFLADQKAHEKSVSDLSGMFKSVTGKGDSAAEKMATTFKRLTEKADWSAPLAVPSEPEPTAHEERDSSGLRRRDLTLNQDVHIHLPPTSDVAVYTAIFRALREELLD